MRSYAAPNPSTDSSHIAFWSRKPEKISYVGTLIRHHTELGLLGPETLKKRTGIARTLAPTFRTVKPILRRLRRQDSCEGWPVRGERVGLIRFERKRRK
jgi:hypothetical protein